MPEKQDNEDENETVIENNGAMTSEEREELKVQLQEERDAHIETKNALALKDERISLLEADIQMRDEQIQAIRKESEKNAALVMEFNKRQEIDLARYRETLIIAYPDIPASLIHGDSFESLSDAVEKGKELVKVVKERITAESEASMIPAGAPAREGLSLEGMSSREKINAGIKQTGGK
jgi:hypothetical protein